MRPIVIAGGGVAALIALLLSKGGSDSSLPILMPIGYKVKPSDRLWLLRAVQAESNKPSDRLMVAETLVNRFVFLDRKGASRYPTLSKLVRAYAQPVNPLWENKSTSKCRANPRRCTEATLAKRRESRTRNTFDESTVDAVDRALSSGITSVSKSSVHYAAPGIGAANKIKLTPDRNGYNTFYAVTGSKNWNGYTTA